MSVSTNRKLPLSSNAIQYREQRFLEAAKKLDNFGLFCLIVVGAGWALYEWISRIYLDPRFVRKLAFAVASAVMVAYNGRYTEVEILISVALLSWIAGRAFSVA